MSSVSSFEYQSHQEQSKMNSSENLEFNSYGINDYYNYGNTNESGFLYATNVIQKDENQWPSSLFRCQNDDLRSMLESNKEGLKLEAMKRLISMIAKGRPSSDTVARDLFPHVVKNVVTKNVELKKLVYLYLTRYAEQEQDLALLSISSFQRSLKDPNPLIRASALRVLSSIRVPVIAPIVLIAIKECSNDMSPYVRKTASHAISKLYNLDPDLKDEIILIIERLLQDKTSLVLGSAVTAFQEVCPDRFDLIHPNYRKFVSLMPDFDEWGQVVLINLLIRYAKSQFLDPNIKLDEKNEDLSNSLGVLDPDHRLLLRNSKPLLQSRNSAVVLAVIQLYLELAPHSEVNSIIVKPLLRLLHSYSEIQIIILSNILTITGPPFPTTNGSTRTSLKHLFEPYLKSFFIKSRDSTQIKILKLKILTNLSSLNNIPLILKEFQVYINNYQGDMEFFSAIIYAIGKCASRIKEVAPLCLNGLISLLSNRNEAIVAQSIIVIRTQIIQKEQIQEMSKNSNKNENDESDTNIKADSIVTLIIKQVIRLIDKIETPNARATILWILAEFCNKNEKCFQVSPDVLRIIAKTFYLESSLVKLQAINLASKIFLTINFDEKCIFNETEKAKIKLLVNYIFNLAKYDVNYDVRDRGRFLKQLISKCDSEEGFNFATKILMEPKKTSLQKSEHDEIFEYSSSYRIGTLSHFIDKKVVGYEELPNFPKVQPDPSVRSKPGFEDSSNISTLENLKNDFVKKSSKSEESFFFDSDDSSDYDESNETSEEEKNESDKSNESDDCNDESDNCDDESDDCDDESDDNGDNNDEKNEKEEDDNNDEDKNEDVDDDSNNDSIKGYNDNVSNRDDNKVIEKKKSNENEQESCKNKQNNNDDDQDDVCGDNDIEVKSKKNEKSEESTAT